MVELNVNTPSTGMPFVPVTGGDSSGATSATSSTNAATQAYYTDSASAGSNSEKAVVQSKNMLANMPAPGSQVAGAGTSAATNVSGTSGTGNPFLAPGCLAAFFVAMNEMANTLIKADVINVNTVAKQMSLLNELAQDQAQQILNSSEAEANTYMASAISSFCQGGASLVSGALQMYAARDVNKEMENENTNLGNDKTEAQKKLDKAETELGTDNPIGEAEVNVMKTQKKLDGLKEDHEALKKGLEPKDPNNKTKTPQDLEKEITQTDGKLQDAKAARNDAEEKASLAEKNDFKRKQKAFDTAQERYDAAEKKQQDFQDNYFQNRANRLSTNTQIYTSFTQAFSQLSDGAMNVWKSQLALEKGRSDALNAELQVYIQNVSKTIDQLNSMKDANSKVIEQLMQFLQQTSNSYAQSFNKLSA